MKQLLMALISLAGLSLMCNGPYCVAETNAVASVPPTPAPSFSVPGLAGKPVKLEDFKGKALLVVFWATWAKPCQEQLPILIELQKKYGGESFTVLAISLDEKGPAHVQAYIDSHQVNFPVAMFNYDVVSGFGGIQGIPAMFLIERKHYILQRYTGVTELKVLEADLKSILEQPTQ